MSFKINYLHKYLTLDSSTHQISIPYIFSLNGNFFISSSSIVTKFSHSAFLIENILSVLSQMYIQYSPKMRCADGYQSNNKQGKCVLNHIMFGVYLNNHERLLLFLPSLLLMHLETKQRGSKLPIFLVFKHSSRIQQS